MYTNHLNYDIYGRGIFFLGGGGFKNFLPVKMPVFAMIIVFLTFLGLGVEYFRLGKTHYSSYTERRSASENCIIDNTHCIVFSF